MNFEDILGKKRQLPRSSWTNNRNKAKPYRPVRTDDNGNGKFPDVMTVYDKDGNPHKQVTTGCYGIKSTWQPRVYVPGPKTGKLRNFKRKSVCRLFFGNAGARHDKDSLVKVVALRGKVLTMLQIAAHFKMGLGDGFQSSLGKMDKYIMNVMDQSQLAELHRQDIQRTKSIVGQIKAGHITGFEFCKRLGREIDAAMMVIGL
jgi:hypothetical protein